MKGFLLLPALLIFLFGTPAFADFAKGQKAFDNSDYAAALKEWKPLAEKGNAPAQFWVGFIYEQDRGVPYDPKAAFKWYKLAAEQGHDKAQHKLGFLYSIGEGVTQDYKAAFKWVGLAIEQGNASHGAVHVEDEIASITYTIAV